MKITLKDIFFICLILFLLCWGFINALTIHLSIGLGFISIGLAFISIYFGLFSFEIANESKKIAEKSDKKMKSIANSNFIEKHAMMHAYIDKLNHKEYGCLHRCKTDLESSLELKDWVDDDKKEQLVVAVIKLIKIALVDDSQWYRPIFKRELEGFLEILDTSTKFNIKNEDLEELKKQLKKKILKRKR